MDFIPDSWDAIICFMLNRPINKSIWSIIQRLLLGASLYYVWQERNLRTFQGKSRPSNVLIYLIKDVARLRVLSLRLNASKQVFEAADLWGFHVMHGHVGRKIKFKL